MRLDKAYQGGVGLIEVMVALLLLAMSVLGYSALQMTALTLTQESAKQSVANSLMAQLGQSIRANPTASHVFANHINQDVNADSVSSHKHCGLLSSVSLNKSSACTAQQLAIAEASIIKKQAYDSGLTIKIMACPTHGAQSVYCAIIDWGQGEDSASCVNAKGVYRPNSSCLIAELS